MSVTFWKKRTANGARCPACGAAVIVESLPADVVRIFNTKRYRSVKHVFLCSSCGRILREETAQL